jgi:putative nucleotidyltransferase with HDIG domain
MFKFVAYLDPSLSPEERLRGLFDELRLPNEEREAIVAFLKPLKIKDLPTYEHCIRVGLLTRRIARFMHFDEKALCFAGLLHDIGKAQTDPLTLQKTEGWTPADTEAIKEHVLDGFRFLRGRLDFTAQIIAQHHRFQKDGYPNPPELLHDYCLGTQTMIMMYGRLLALADCFDALHRVNDKFDQMILDGEHIREKMLVLNSDQKKLVLELYNAGIFTTYTVDQEKVEREPDEHDRLYYQAWLRQQARRTPRETRRHICLATALEPLSDKSGCTTRHRNLSQYQKLEYFIAGGINIGDAFEDLAEAIECAESLRIGIYRFALVAQQESKRNRRGGRVNQGIIEMLLPIVAAQHDFDCKRGLTAKQVLEKAAFVLHNTSSNDIQHLREAKRFAFDLSGYTDRPVPDYPNAKTVFDYYAEDLKVSEKPTSIAHNQEFVNGFPTVAAIYERLQNCHLPDLNSKVEEAYRYAASLHDPQVASGFLADCVAVGIYLLLSHDPLCKLVS